MKRILWLFSLLLIAIWIGSRFHFDSGYVLLAYRNWTVEMTIWVAVALFAVLFLAFYVIWRVLRLPFRCHRWYSKRHGKRALHSMRKAMIAYIEGHLLRAEKLFIQTVASSPFPLINYWFAIRISQRQSSYKRREHYLRDAEQLLPDANLPTQLMRVESYIAAQQLEQALAVLRHLQSRHPKQRRVLYLLYQVYWQLSDWQQLQRLYPILYKYRVVHGQAASDLECAIYRGLLNAIPDDAALSHIEGVWQSLPKHIQRTTSVLLIYVPMLLARDALVAAEQCLYPVVKHHWHAGLIELYGLTQAPAAKKQFAVLEAWLKKKSDDTHLVLALARLAMRHHLWGKARHYLMQCLAATTPPMEAHAEMALLLDKLGDQELALEHYRIACQHFSPITRF